MIQKYYPDIASIVTDFLTAASSLPDEEDFQEKIAEKLRRGNLKTFREARYPGKRRGNQMKIDLVMVEQQTESWNEIKLVKHIKSQKTKQTKTNAFQGIPGSFKRDFFKLNQLPTTISRGFIAIGLFSDYSTSNRVPLIDTAIQSANPSWRHTALLPITAGCAGTPDLKDAYIWYADL